MIVNLLGVAYAHHPRALSPMSTSFRSTKSVFAVDAGLSKLCGGCHRLLPRSSYIPRQWTNSSWHGSARRCNSCTAAGSYAGLICDPADIARTVSAAAIRMGGSAGAEFPAHWERACKASASEGTEAKPLHLGRLCAVLSHNLDAQGASKEDKRAYRALAEDCWLALSGASPKALASSKAAGQRPALSVEGVAGLLATCDKAKGRKALAAAELAAAVRIHAPFTVPLGEDVASVQNLVFLPYIQSFQGSGEGGAAVEPEGRTEGAVSGARAVEAALGAIQGVGFAFAHVHRVWAVQHVALSPAHSVATGRQILSGALCQQAANLEDRAANLEDRAANLEDRTARSTGDGGDLADGSTFAIRCDSWPPRTLSTKGRRELVEEIASAAMGKVWGPSIACEARSETSARAIAMHAALICT